jgi:hypothetical protein
MSFTIARPFSGPFFILGLFLFWLPQLRAQEMTFKSDRTDATLLELYSSEGCSSCPPAEAWIGQLQDSPKLWREIYPAVFHVDYWDGLGWPDRFARPAYTERQRDYASRLGQDSVYTPEFVASGREWRGWFDGKPLPSPQNPTSGELTLSTKKEGGEISVTYLPAAGATPSTYLAHVALLGNHILSDVTRGENGGRRLEHDFVVLNFVSGPMTSGASGRLESGPLALPSSTGDAPAALVGWISTPDGVIVQVAGGWLKSSDTSKPQH